MYYKYTISQVDNGYVVEIEGRGKEEDLQSRSTVLSFFGESGETLHKLLVVTTLEEAFNLIRQYTLTKVG